MQDMASESGGGGASERASGCCEVEGDGNGGWVAGGVCGGTEVEREGEKGRCWGWRWEGTDRDVVVGGGVEEVARG